MWFGLEIDGKYFYGSNSYKNGILRDNNKCIAEVTHDKGFNNRQCQQKNGFGHRGLLCKTHAKKFSPEIGYPQEEIR